MRQVRRRRLQASERELAHGGEAHVGEARDAQRGRMAEKGLEALQPASKYAGPAFLLAA